MTKHPLLTLYLVMVAWAAAWTALKSPGGPLELALTPFIGSILPWLVTVWVYNKAADHKLRWGIITGCLLGIVSLIPN